MKPGHAGYEENSNKMRGLADIFTVNGEAKCYG
jgi:hypothetical protein